MSGPLVCPACHASHDEPDRFCHECGMPLVRAGAPGEPSPVTERHERARKVSPQYGEGDLVKVGWARNQAEAELISGFLLEEGIPSVAKRARGFDVPDFLAAGPRDILVAASGADAAREVLRAVDEAPDLGDPARDDAGPAVAAAWVRLLAVVLVLVLLGLLAAGVLRALSL